MTKREAKRLVCRVAAVTVENDVEVGADWIYCNDDGSDRSSDDIQRVLDAIEEFGLEMRRRAKGPGGEDE